METPQSRKIELRAMIVAAIVLLAGLFSAYQVKTQRPIPFSELSAKMSREETNGKGKTVKKVPEIVNLKELKDKENLLPYLTKFENEADRNFAAEKLIKEIDNYRESISNVGFLGTRRVTKGEIGGAENAENLEYFKITMENASKRAEERKGQDVSFINRIRNFISPKDETVQISILGGLGSLKNSFIVRTPEEFFNSLIIWSLVFFCSFFGLHLFWRYRKFDGDGLILPPIFLLCGIGFLMMISMRDPLRDSLSFADFAFGTALGCLAVAVITAIDFQHLSFRLQRKYPKFADKLLTYSPIILAVFLSLALILFGITPGASDAKVNLNIGIATIQPSEIIKILFALFAASYFSERWEYFRYLEKNVWQFSLPRFKDVWLLALFVAALLALFFLQKDLGPALLMAGLFLTLFAVVRKRVTLSLLGFSAIIAAYVVNYYRPISVTAAERLDIWRNPWDTQVTGGEQIVHSLWSFATGGLTGTGFGLGDPYFAPAHHTDLILSSLGEELGFIGILLMFAAYGLLFYRCYVVARQAFSPFAYFIVLGLAVINALQLLFISAGVLGLIPLSGVVTPFLSYGMSSMICNLVSFGIVLAVSSEKGSLPANLAAPTKYIAYGFSALTCLILLKAFSVQFWNSDEILVKSVLAPVRDEMVGGNLTTGIRRYTYNPRIVLARKELPFGSVYDRNGIPLASSDWDELNKFAAEYESLGITLSDVCVKGIRCYPFGGKTFHLTGDAVSEKNWAASNTGFIEKDYQNVLRGYNDYAEKINIKVNQKRPIRNEDGEPVINPETNETLIEDHEIDFPIEKKDYKELLPLIHNRYNPVNISANLLKYKNRNIKTSIDIRLQVRLSEILKNEIESQKLKKGAIVVLEPSSGDLLASVNYPIPEDEPTEGKNAAQQEQTVERESFFDRARFGVYQPGSTFKIVTGMAAMREDADSENKEFFCTRLSDGRAGNTVRGRAIKDDILDNPHGTIRFENGLIKSCNAYFAQLGTEIAGADELFKTAGLFNIEVAKPNTAAELNKYLPQSSFGQGEIVASPFQIAKVSATVANGGLMQTGRWITDDNNLRNNPAIQIITSSQASVIAKAMRGVVTTGTGRKMLAANPIQIAGKTGTAENPFGASHSWFTGFAPYNNPNRQIAFAVLIENGGYGGGIAARITDKVVRAAGEIGIVQ